MFPFSLFKKKEGEEKEFIDDELLRKLTKIKHAVERREDKIKKLERAFLKYQVLFNRAVGKGQIRDKDTINAVIQHIVVLIKDAKENVKKEESEKKLAA